MKHLLEINEQRLALTLIWLIFAKTLGLFDLSITLEYSKISPTGNRVFWLMIFFISLFLFVRLLKQHQWQIEAKNLLSMIPISLILLFIFLSISWSNYPDITLRRAALQLTVVFSVIFLIHRYLNFETLFKIIYGVFWIALILNYLSFIIGTPFDNHASGFKGVYSAKNVAGLVSALAIFVGVYRLYQLKSEQHSFKITSIYLVGWLLILAVSLSKTSIALLVISPLLTLFILQIINRSSWNFYFKTLMVAGIFLLMSLTLIGVDIYKAGIDAGLQLGFTGRDLIWSVMFQDFTNYWLLGHGYGAFWDVGEDIQSLQTDSKLEFLSFIVQGHNGYLDVLLTVGSAGLLLYFLWLIQIFKGLINQAIPAQQLFLLITLLVFVMLHNMTESSILRGDHLIWIIHLLIFSLIFKRNRFNVYHNPR